LSGKYPLQRFLYLTINCDERHPLSPKVREYLRLVYGRQGQEIVVKDGYYSLTRGVVETDAKRAGITLDPPQSRKK